jgi:putative endonuclease
MYTVYILRCADGSLYTGITNDINARMKKHVAGKGAAYTRAKKVEKLVYSETAKDRSAALRREAEIKSWSRAKKLELVRAGI